MVGNPTPTPVGGHETPSAGIDWKLFLLIAGIIGAVFFAGMAMQSDGDSISSTVDADSPNIDIGQGSGPDNPPVAVETETGDTKIENGYIEKLPSTMEVTFQNSRKEYPKNCRITELKEENHRISFCIENNKGYPMQIWQLDIKAPCGTSIYFFNDIEIAGNEKKCFVTKDLRECDGVHFPVKNIRITVI